MAAALNLFLVLIPASLLGFTSQQEPQILHRHNHHLSAQLHQAKLKLAVLESDMDELNQIVSARELYLEGCEYRIGEMDKKINALHSVLSAVMATSSSPAHEKIIALEEEARVLWAALRKNNFDIHVLEFKAREAEDRLQTVTSRVEKMADIVNEQWIQIQQFEQALLLGEMKLSRAQRQVKSPRCIFLKFMHDLSGEYLPETPWLLGLHSSSRQSALSSHVSRALDQLKRLYLLLKDFHHELQGLIKQEMEKHEFTATLANKELVFIVASALIVFPVLSAWMWLSSYIR